MTDVEIERFVMQLFAADNMSHAVKMVRQLINDDEYLGDTPKDGEV